MLRRRRAELLAAKPKADWVAYLEDVTALPEPRGPLEGLVGHSHALGTTRIVFREGLIRRAA